MSKRIEELKEQAQHLIVEALRAAEMRQGCTDYGYYAELLLRQLEPIIEEYVPVPERIVKALPDTRYGRQTPTQQGKLVIGRN